MSDTPAYTLSFEGKVTQPSIEIATRRYEGSMQDMMPKIGEGFSALFAACKGKEIKDRPLMVWERFDEKEDSVSLIMGVPTSNDASFEGFERVTVTGGFYLRAVMRGGYENLRQAWEKANQHVAQEHEYDDERNSYEIYDNDPQQVANPADFQTSLYLPIKE